MTVLATRPPVVGTDAFYNVSRDIPVYVTMESLTAYQNTGAWKNFNLQDAIPIIASGTCGNNLTWTLTDDGALTISGTGNMKNYVYHRSPWSSYAENIKKVLIEQGATSIGDYTFIDCNNLISIIIPDGIMSIGNYSFSSCSSLTAITIPNGVTSIGDYAFYNCKSLTSIAIPNGVTSIGKMAFHNCSSLSYITIPDGVKSMGDGMFHSCSSLISIAIPKDMTRIGESTFSFCSSLTSITIPEGVTSIGDYAFQFCEDLTSITIPEGVTSVGERAFRDCSGLTQMTVLATTPPTVNIDAFNNVSRDIPVYVPEESLTAYQNADVWKEFNLQVLSSTGLHTPDLPESIRVYDGLLHNPQGLLVSLYNMQGCQVYSGKDTILRMPAGVYVLQCGTASGKVMFP